MLICAFLCVFPRKRLRRMRTVPRNVYEPYTNRIRICVSFFLRTPYTAPYTYTIHIHGCRIRLRTVCMNGIPIVYGRIRFSFMYMRTEYVAVYGTVYGSCTVPMNENRTRCHRSYKEKLISVYRWYTVHIGFV